MWHKIKNQKHKKNKEFFNKRTQEKGKFRIYYNTKKKKIKKRKNEFLISKIISKNQIITARKVEDQL